MASLLMKENGGGGGGTPKVDKIVTGMSVGNPTRQRLADISNLLPQSKPLGQDLMLKSSKECIDELVKENMALMKLLAERNKVLESCGLQLQNLRINLQKVQLQNSQLALANSQMLAELTSDKDRLKMLQHELACKNGLLKAANMELVEKGKRKRCQNNGGEGAVKSKKAEKAERDGKKPCPVNPRKQCEDQSLAPSTTEETYQEEMERKRRGQSAKLRSSESVHTEKLFDGTDAEVVQAREKADVKRRSSRSQSASSISRKTDCSEDKFETDNVEEEAKERAENKRHCSRGKSTKFELGKSECTEDKIKTDEVESSFSSLHNVTKHENIATVSEMKENEVNTTSRLEAPEFRRSSVGRPLRRAAERVQSYKEIPLNKKMRRAEWNGCTEMFMSPLLLH